MEVTTIRAQGESLLEKAEAFKVTDAASLEQVGEELRAIKHCLKTLDSLMDPAIAAAHIAHKEMLDVKKQVQTPFQKAEKILKGKTADYLDEQERERQAALALSAQAGEIAAPIEKTEAPQGVSTRVVWRFRITDAKAIPAQYLIPDEAAIRKVVWALGDRAAIPGVEVYSEQIVAVRA